MQLNEKGLTDSVIRKAAGANERSDAFLRMLLDGEGKDCKHEWLASALFAEVVASAGMWAKAVTGVVEYWLQGGRIAKMQDAVKDTTKNGNHDKVLECVREALRKWLWLRVFHPQLCLQIGSQARALQ